MNSQTLPRWLRAVSSAIILLLLGAAAPAPPGVALHGVNFAGAEFAAGTLPGTPDRDYVYPSAQQLDWAVSSGFNIIRLPVLWERLQPALDGPLAPAELARVRAVVDGAVRRGIRTVIDLHNFGTYRGQLPPAAAFANFWSQMAQAFGRDRLVIFGLMNEPHDQPVERWALQVQAAIDAIRATGAKTPVLVPGVGWDGAHNFVSGAGYGTPSTRLSSITDPAHALAFEVHQYLDADYSGTHPECPAAQNIPALLDPMTKWLRDGHRQGFMGEFAASSRPECLAGLAAMLRYFTANRDVWGGWTYWAAGAWWGPDYPFAVEPRGGTTPPQLAILQRQGRQ